MLLKTAGGIRSSSVQWLKEICSFHIPVCLKRSGELKSLKKLGNIIWNPKTQPTLWNGSVCLHVNWTDLLIVFRRLPVRYRPHGIDHFGSDLSRLSMRFRLVTGTCKIWYMPNNVNENERNFILTGITFILSERRWTLIYILQHKKVFFFLSLFLRLISCACSL
jgi:hypothetical protein